MGIYQENFQRYEIKYLLTDEQVCRFWAVAKDRLAPDHYADSTVRSIYFDTPDYRMIRRSLERPVYKEKLRLRSYEAPGPESPVFVELKKKFGGIVYKRRTERPLATALAWLCNQNGLAEMSQIEKEIAYAIHFYPALAPAMLITSERKAWVGIQDPGLRITFDRRILWRQEDLSLDRGVGGNALLPAGTQLMEIKAPGALPVWLPRILYAINGYPTSFSKYGNAYRVMMQQRLRVKRGDICA